MKSKTELVSTKSEIKELNQINRYRVTAIDVLDEMIYSVKAHTKK